MIFTNDPHGKEAGMHMLLIALVLLSFAISVTVVAILTNQLSEGALPALSQMACCSKSIL